MQHRTVLRFGMSFVFKTHYKCTTILIDLGGASCFIYILQCLWEIVVNIGGGGLELWF